MWGKVFSMISIEVQGAYWRGIIYVWNPCVFVNKNVPCTENYIVFEGNWGIWC